MPPNASLFDQQAIRDVIHRYATALDTRDFELLASCFTDDVTVVYSGHEPLMGYVAVEAFVDRALAPLDRTQHLIGNVEVDVAGDVAHATSYLQAQHVREGLPGGTTFLIGGRYVDRLVRTQEGWRITHRELERWWTDGNPEVTRRAPDVDEPTTKAG